MTWKETTLGEAAEKIGIGPFGSNIKVETFVPTGIPVISGNHLRGVRLEDNEYNFVSEQHANQLASANVRRGDVIFTHAGNIGQVAYIPETSRYERYVLSQRQFYLRPGPLLSAEWLTYYFHSRLGRHQLLTYANQVGVPSIAQPVTNLRNTIIHLPPVETQREIVAILASLDEKIVLLQKQNRILLEIAQRIFNKRFVEQTSGGVLPPGWRTTTMADVCSQIASGGTPSTKMEEYYSGPIQWFSTKELVDDFLFESERTITEDGLSNSAAKLFPQGTVVMAIYAAPTVGRLGILTREASFNQAAVGFVPDIQLCSTEFVYLYLLSERDALNNLANGAAQQNISVGLVRTYPVTLPSNDGMSELNAMVKPLFAKILNNSREMRTMIAVRNSLLPRLMTGALTL